MVFNIIYYDIPEIVSVRKYEVDIMSFQKCLKEHKNITIKKIAEYCNVTKTQADHWFRTDKFFALPDADSWYKLKELLNIKTDEFDESLTTFIYKEGVHEQTNRVYDANGIAPTITSASADIRIINYED